MGTLLLHLTVGLLLGLALRLSWKRLPIAALLAALPDLDHFAPLESRVTFHNVFFAGLLPLLVLAAVLAWPSGTRGAGFMTKLRAELLLLTAAPALVWSHLVLDLLPLEVSGARVALFWPLDGTMYVLANELGRAVDPTSSSTMVLVVLLLLLAAACTHALRWALGGGAGPRARLPASTACAAAFLLLFPALGLAGAVFPAPTHPEARLGVSEDSGGDGVALRVTHLGGETVGRNALRLEAWSGGTLVFSDVNDGPLIPGVTWESWVPGLAPDAEVRLTAQRDRHVYMPLHPLAELAAVHAH